MWQGIYPTKYTWVFAREVIILEKAVFDSFAARLWFIHSVLFLHAVSNFFPVTVFNKNVDHGSSLHMMLFSM